MFFIHYVCLCSFLLNFNFFFYYPAGLVRILFSKLEADRVTIAMGSKSLHVEDVVKLLRQQIAVVSEFYSPNSPSPRHSINPRFYPLVIGSLRSSTGMSIFNVCNWTFFFFATNNHSLQSRWWISMKSASLAGMTNFVANNCCFFFFFIIEGWFNDANN